MRKKDLLRLFALSLILVFAFTLITFQLRPQRAQPAIPTLRALPSETSTSAEEVAALPTSSITVALPTNAPTYTSSATSTGTFTSTETSTTTDTATGVPTVNVRPSPTNTVTAMSTLQPTQLPFPTVQIQQSVLPPAEPVANKVIITFAPQTSPQQQAAYVESIGGEITRNINELNAVVVEVPANTVAESLPSSSVVAETQPDYYVTALLDVPPNDTLYPQQWALPAINAPDAWAALSPDAPAVVVAVIDSGICADHPDLQGKVLPGWDYVENDANPQDDFDHGCGVAGIIAADLDNSIGVAGVAPNARILPLRVLDASGVGTYSNVAAAIIAATDQGAKIINLSLGGSMPSSLLEDAVNYAASRGVTVVAAAGNTGQPGVLYPAAYPAVIAVGSVDANLQPSSFNSTGPEIDTYAPGRNILSLTKAGGYAAMSGTSFAAPQVAGIAALETAFGQPLNLDGGVAHFGDAAPVTAEAPTLAPIDEGTLTDNERRLLDEVRAQGQTDVIVGLNVLFRYADQASPQELAAQDAVVQQVRGDLLSSLSSYDVEVLSDSTSWAIPYVALRVDENALLALIASPATTTLDPNGRNSASLQSAEPVIHAPQVWAMGYTGSGQTVAIVDTGVDRTHPFLNNHVVSEACYSYSGSGATSNCPNGSTFQTGIGAASPATCFANLSSYPNQAEGCAHGTHVAGIAAGYQSTSFSGVAPNANIIAVNVFSTYANSATAFDTEIISGLNYVYNLRNTYSIAAVNLSLGDFGRASSSTCDSKSSSMTSIFQLLRSAGIAPVVAAGNDSSTTLISYPACISYAVSVGATTDADAIASFSNRGSILSLFAPGVSITSSVPIGSVADPGSGYAAWNGTSMATPFITGAFAVYRQLVPTSSVSLVLSSFQMTGQPIDIGGSSISRLNLQAAVLASMPPTITTQPASQTINSGQTATLSVGATGTAPLSYQWYRGAVSDTTNPVGTNSASFTTPALTTTTSYWVRVSNTYGHADSSTATITVPSAAPANVNLLTNGSFTSGLSAWNVWGITAQVNSQVLEAALPANTASGGFGQSITHVLPASAPLELSLQLGNSSAAAKSVTIFLSTPSWSEIRSCSFTIPAGAPLQAYTMQTTTAGAWSGIALSITLNSADGLMALRADDLNLQYKPALSVSGTNCVAPAANANVNLLTNGSFTSGLSAWNVWGITAQVNSQVLEAALPANTASGGFGQSVTQPLPASAPLELSLQLGNSSAAAKSITVFLSTPSWSEIRSCSFTIPAGAPLQAYTMQTTTAGAWSGIALSITLNSADGLMALRADDLNLQYKPALSVSGTNCVAPAANANVNLLTNGSFTSGLSAWNVWGITAQVNSQVLEAALPANTASGGFGQSVTQPLPASAPLELSLQLGNSSAAAKSITVFLSTPSWSEIRSCSFTIPAGAPLQAYTMQTTTAGAWSGIALSIALNSADGLMALRADDLNLQYKPALSVSGTNCVAPAANANVNLLTNGSFTSGLSAWNVWGITTQVNSQVLEAALPANTASGGFGQSVTQPLPASAPLELSLQLGNSSAAAKSVTIFLSTPSWSEIRSCSFTIPAGAPLQAYTMQTTTAGAWSGIALSIALNSADGLMALRADDLNLQYKPALSVSGTQCQQVTGLAVTEETTAISTATLLPTQTLNLTLTPSATETSTATATDSPTPTPTPSTEATFTPEITETPASTEAIAPTESLTLTATNTLTPTDTPVPPTASPTFTATPTDTPVPPTASPTFTATPTDTPVPPTASPTFKATPTDTPVPPTASPTFTPTETASIHTPNHLLIQRPRPRLLRRRLHRKIRLP